MIRVALILLLLALPAHAQTRQGPYPPFPSNLVAGDCIKALNAYQAKDAGAPCGVGTITAGLINQLAYYAASGTTISGLATANSGILVTSAGGVPSISSTIPAATQDNITRLGTVASGAWQATLIAGQYGGTGVANTGKTLTLGGNLTLSGAFASTFTMSNTTTVTFPTTGTLATLAGNENLSNKTLASPALSGTVTGNNTVPLSILAQIATNTVLGNATNATANVAAQAMPSCSAAGSALKWTADTGFGCNIAIDAATLGGATFAAPGAIGGGTPAAGTFTTLSASNSSVHLTGLTATPGSLQPMCIDTGTGQIYKGAAGAC